jgi:hypothetical protein
MASSDTRDYVVTIESNKDKAHDIAKSTAKSTEHNSQARAFTDAS